MADVRVLVCPGSLDAIQGALGTVCEAVDAVLRDEPQPNQAFVAIRPPGHHCGEVCPRNLARTLLLKTLQDTPSGFCFVNNVAVGAAHGMDKPQHLEPDV